MDEFRIKRWRGAALLKGCSAPRGEEEGWVSFSIDISCRRDYYTGKTWPINECNVNYVWQ
jgi:hypothetical protein